MLGIIETPFGLLDMYVFCINAGVVVTILLQMVLLMRKRKGWKSLTFPLCYLVLLWIGQYAAAFVRCVNDGALDGKMNLRRGVLELAGTHFLGHVFVYSVLLFPLLWMVSSLFMEPDWNVLIKGANILFLCLPVQHIFNRLGCLCRGCCYGVSYQGLFAISLPYNQDIPYTEVFPSQLLEIACMIVLLFLVCYRYRKGKNVIGVVMIGSAVTFFLSEFFTCNPYAVKHFGLTYVQYFSLLELVLGGLYLVLAKDKRENSTK